MFLRTGMTRKELAAKAKISASYLGKGLNGEISGYPSADKAVRLARALGTTVEYLVSGSVTSQKESTANLDILYKYERTILNLSTIPEKQRTLLETLIDDIRASYSADSSEKA